MSEVGEAIQILMIMGNVSVLLGRTSLKTAVQVGKVMNTVYLSKWKGKTGLSRFRNIKGDVMEFINLGTEDRSFLRAVEKEMKAHGILFARMPDLCGGDGQTQYVIAPSDLPKFKAFLVDHANGKYRKVRAGLITASDYAKSGFDEKNGMTKELDELTKSAGEEQKKHGKAIEPFPIRVRYKDTEEKFSLQEADQILKRFPQLKKQEMDAQYGEGIRWLRGTKIEEQGEWLLCCMEESGYGVLVPKEDALPVNKMAGQKRAAEQGNVYGAEVKEQEYMFGLKGNQEYTLINQETGQRETVNGSKLPEYLERAKKLDQTNAKNIQKKDPGKNRNTTGQKHIAAKGKKGKR